MFLVYRYNSLSPAVLSDTLWLLPTMASHASITFICNIHQQVSELHNKLLNKWHIQITWTVKQVILWPG